MPENVKFTVHTSGEPAKEFFLVFTFLDGLLLQEKTHSILPHEYCLGVSFTLNFQRKKNEN